MSLIESGNIFWMDFETKERSKVFPREFLACKVMGSKSKGIETKLKRTEYNSIRKYLLQLEIEQMMLFFWFIRFVLGVDINGIIQTAFQPVVFALNTLPGILVYALLVTLLWSVGINGDNTMDAIVAPIFLQYLAANVEAVTQGQPLPYVTAYGFFTAFVNVGGTGATIGLALSLAFSKEPGFRKVSRLSLPTQIFQINEPILFGMPIVLNPIFMLPFILNALILTTCSYLLMEWNVIHKPFVNVPWTTPPIIGHYLVSGGDWKAAVWGAISIVIAVLIYYPFAKVAERQRLAAESSEVADEQRNLK